MYMFNKKDMHVLHKRYISFYLLALTNSKIVLDEIIF